MFSNDASARIRAALLVLALALAQFSPAFAGSTGTLTGTVSDATTHARLPGVRVRAVSPSQSATVTTQQNGRFTFLNLAPDTYTVSVDKAGYNATVTQGVTVQADQAQDIALATTPVTKVIGLVRSRSTSDLVRPGTTADVYSYDQAAQRRVSVFGGGGDLNQVYSGMAATPGITVPFGQAGKFQKVYARGGDYWQTGYEYDGIPLNEPFSNSPATALSTLGQQELQVFTGGAPVSNPTSGLTGFVNQVIRTGTDPGFVELNATSGDPTAFGSGKFELGGVTENHRFSYYGGYLSSDQTFHYYDNTFNNNGQYPYQAALLEPSSANQPATGSYSGLDFTGGGLPFSGVAPLCVNGAPGPTPVGVKKNPGCYVVGPTYLFGSGSSDNGSPQRITDKEAVANFHYNIPHGGQQDDIQALVSNSYMVTYPFSSALTLGGILDGPNYWKDGYTLAGTSFGQSAVGLKPTPYYFPYAPQNQAFNAPGTAPTAAIPVDLSDASQAFGTITKLQYTHNFSDSTYARLFAYQQYTATFTNDPNAIVDVIGSGSVDSEQSEHTHGYDFQLGSQLGEHLLKFTTNWATTNLIRDNAVLPTPQTNFVDLTTLATAPTCLSASLAPAPCNAATTQGNATKGLTPYLANGATLPNGDKAGWIVTEPGASGLDNRDHPTYAQFALSDQLKLGSRLSADYGVRLEQFAYALQDTDTPGRDFWYAVGEKEWCYQPGTLLVSSTPALTCPKGYVHPDGQSDPVYGQHLLLSNLYDPNILRQVWEPRAAFTYTLDPDTVLRAAWGRYAQPMYAASVQYNLDQQNIAAYNFQNFWGDGFTTPRHDTYPAVSNNTDLSLEHHFAGSDLSLKFSPYFRETANQFEYIIVAGASATSKLTATINAGQQRSDGFEFQLNKGNFNRNGFAASLAYGYTFARIRYSDLNGTALNPIDQINQFIQKYNSFTAACAGAAPSQNLNALCGTFGGSNAHPYFTTAGNGTPGTAGAANSVINPYYSTAAEPLLDRNASYIPFQNVPVSLGLNTASFLVPNVVTATVQYKHQRLAIAPSLQLLAGQPYGTPIQVLGYNPATCTANSLNIPTAVTAGRGGFADYTSCGASLPIPNPETGRFDRIGEYTEPSQLVAHLTITYDVNPRVRASLTFANLLSTCFGGTQAAWATGGSSVCQYGLNTSNTVPYYSNFWNGASPYDVAANSSVPQSVNAHSYNPNLFKQPLEVFFNVGFKL